MLTAEQVREWMQKVKEGTDNPEHLATDRKGQYTAVLAEYTALLDALGVGSGQLDVEDTVALLGVAVGRVFGP